MAGAADGKKGLLSAIRDQDAYRKNYWRLGFKTRLYDLFTPWAYTESLAKSASRVPGGARLLDAGCGNGQLIPQLAGRGVRYVGADRLVEGLRRAQERPASLPERGLLKWDLAAPSPFAPESFDAVVAHFSIYTLAEASARAAAWRNLFTLTRPGGVLIASNPTTTYSATAILSASYKAEKRARGAFAAGARRLLAAPITLRLGLGYIERELAAGRFHAYTAAEFKSELEACGWRVEEQETVYAGSGLLIQARRP